LLATSLLRYFITAQNEHGLHSPFVFDLYRNIIKNTEQNPDYERIESIRSAMGQRRDLLRITDYGAGSSINHSPVREVRDIARNSEKSPRIGQLFYRLVQHFGYQTCVDLGTSLGMTTAYLAAANPNGRVLTFEGCAETLRVAKSNFDTLALKNIETVLGNLDETLPSQIANVSKIDFAFFDANHRYEPTVRYFETCLTKAHAGSLFVFDDIHWSVEMEAAWKTIQAHPSVIVTIDLMAVGLVFFRPQQAKQHFTLRWRFW
jgi:predicted O-methyltransferase YrrM